MTVTEAGEMGSDEAIERRGGGSRDRLIDGVRAGVDRWRSLVRSLRRGAGC